MHQILLSLSHIITRKIWLLPAVLFMLTPSAKSQKYGVSLEAGQQFGINNLKAQDVPFPSETKFSMGNGVCRQFMFHVYPDSSNWYVSFGFNHLSGNDVVTAQRENMESMNYQVATRTLNSLRFIGRVSYLYTVRTFSFSFSAGLILPVLSKTREEYSVKDSFEYSKTNSQIRNYTSLGFNGSIGISKQITTGIKFFLNSDINILNHQVKSKKITGYENSRGKTIENVYPDISSRETHYHKDPKQIKNNSVLPQGINKDLATDKLSYRVTDSSIGVQVGFLFLF